MPTPIKNTISGSSSATVLGLNPYQSPVEWWQNTLEKAEPGFNESRGYVLPEPFEGNASTRFGHAFESSIIELTEQKLNCKIIDQEKVFKGSVDVKGGMYWPRRLVFNSSTPMSCHVDGITELDGKKVLYEAKTTIDRAFYSKWDIESNTIPRSYMLQLQHNMYLADLDEAIISVLVFPFVPEKLEEAGWGKFQQNDGKYMLTYKKDGITSFIRTSRWAKPLSEMGYHHIFRIQRDDELIAKMLEKYSTFWNDYIIPRKEPEPMNVDDIKRLCPTHRGTIIIDNEDLTNWMVEYKEIGKETGAGGNLKKRQEQLKLLILKAAKEMDKIEDEESANGLIFRDTQGNKLGSWLKSKKGTWSYRG